MNQLISFYRLSAQPKLEFSARPKISEMPLQFVALFYENTTPTLLPTITILFIQRTVAVS